MRTRTGLMVLGLAAMLGAAIAGAGCGDDGSGGSGGNGASGTGASGATGPGGSGGSGATGGSGGSGATGGGAGTGGTGGASDGYCARGCVTPADCCLPNQPNCPSAQYPTNYTCDNGICGSPQCAVKNDCTANGQLPDNDCLSVNGINQCAEPCTVDGDCTAPATCTGMAQGTMFCKVEQPPFTCQPGTSCNGFGVCNAAGDACVCADDGDCTNYVDTCVK